jgi:hypothetical protein
MSAGCYAPDSVFQALVLPDSLSTVCLAVLTSDAVRSHSSFLFYLLIFSLTCLLEAPFYFAAGRLMGRSVRESAKQILLLNLATHPIVFWVIPFAMELLGKNIMAYVLTGEVFAPVVEALILQFWARYPWKYAWITAIAANLFSWWFGLWVLSFYGR